MQSECQCQSGSCNSLKLEFLSCDYHSPDLGDKTCWHQVHEPEKATVDAKLMADSIFDPDL